jgi:tetratricopeptide (TPR) repeat protein
MTVRGVAGAALLAAAALALPGCAAHGPVLPPVVAQRYAARVELGATPFFPQDQYQCGPAALATVLAAAGVAATPESLVEAVYLPGRRGSLQPELVAATRRYDRLPYLLTGSVGGLVATLAGGLPVLVLQKLGAGALPGWHYAVVVGYDAPRDRVVLRSGTVRRKEMKAAHFLATWERAGRWAMVALEPGVLPPEAELGRYMEAAAGLEAVGRLDAAAPAYAAAVRQWPTEPLPRFALANLAYTRGDLVAAERGYREVAHLDPSDAAARNNRAEVLGQMGCGAAARREIEAARALAGEGPLAPTVASTARKIGAMPDRDAAGCPAD